MNTTKLAALGFTVGLAFAAISTPANADPTDQAMMKIKCGVTSPPCIYEKNGSGQIVGLPFPNQTSYGAVARLIGGTLYGLDQIGNNGADPFLIFVYTQPNCAGPAYLEIDHRQLRFAQYDGRDVWVASGPGSTLTWKSVFQVFSTSPNGACYSDPYCGVVQNYNCSISAGPVAHLEQHTFVAPFRTQ